MGFYMLIIDQTNFGLIWKVEFYLKPKVVTGIPISIIKLDLHVLPNVGFIYGHDSHPEFLSQYLMTLVLLYLSLLLK